jgi:hypothetical protein
MDKKTFDDLDGAIARSPAIPEELIVWRLADSAVMHAHASRLVGCELVDFGFLDVTYDERVARGYLAGAHPVLVRIVVPPGTRVFPVFQLNNNAESDLLMARGTRFRVVATRPARDDEPVRLDLELLP